jgi:hypothetical protein
MIDELELLRTARPGVGSPPPDARAAARRALDQRIADRSSDRRTRSRRSPRLGWLAPALGVLATALVVVGVAAVVLSVHGHPSTGGSSRGELELVYRAEPTPQVPVVDSAAIARAVQVMRSRAASLLPGGAGARVTSQGRLIFVHIRRSPGVSLGELRALLGTSARLEFYDWEANVLTPSGRSVARLLSRQGENAELISQGTTAAPPGSPAAGAMTLDKAVKLASRQTPVTTAECQAQNCSRAGAEYFAFGKAGSQACRIAAKHYQVTPIVGVPCYLAGGPNVASLGELRQSLPRGASLSDAKVLVVPQGWAILQGVPQVLNITHLPGWSDTGPDFFVLRDHVALFGDDITHPTQSTDQAGGADVSFGFTGPGATRFQNFTAVIAKRGQLDSGLGQRLFQHFAVGLDTQLLTVPSIDYTQFPFGIPGNNGAEIPGTFTTRSARILAKELSLGALPVRLRLVSSER